MYTPCTSPAIEAIVQLVACHPAYLSANHQGALIAESKHQSDSLSPELFNPPQHTPPDHSFNKSAHVHTIITTKSKSFILSALPWRLEMMTSPKHLSL
jgi:hypothetical protein